MRRRAGWPDECSVTVPGETCRLRAPIRVRAAARPSTRPHPPNLRLTALNDTTVAFAPFPSIIAALIHAGRPLRLTFRDPEVHEFRDRCGRHLRGPAAAQLCRCWAVYHRLSNAPFAAATGATAGLHTSRNHALTPQPSTPQVRVPQDEAARGARGRALLRLCRRVVPQRRRVDGVFVRAGRSARGPGAGRRAAAARRVRRGDVPAGAAGACL